MACPNFCILYTDYFNSDSSQRVISLTIDRYLFEVLFSVDFNRKGIGTRK